MKRATRHFTTWIGPILVAIIWLTAGLAFGIRVERATRSMRAQPHPHYEGPVQSDEEWNGEYAEVPVARNVRLAE